MTGRKEKKVNKEKKEKMVRRTIAIGHCYNLYRIVETGEMELLKGGIILPTKRITDKIVRNIKEEEGVDGQCTLVYVGSKEETYEMSVEKFIANATKVEE